MNINGQLPNKIKEKEQTIMAYQIDTSHSTVEFSVRHMMVSKARGSFDKWSGTVALNEANPAATTVDITLDAASINTKDEARWAPEISGLLRC